MWYDLHGNIVATINRIAPIRWRIQRTKIVRNIFPKQNCLTFACEERVGVERKGLLVAQKTPKSPVITGNSGF